MRQIKVWIDSGANSKSKKVAYMDVDDEWDELSGDEKDDVVQDFIWNCMNAAWGYDDD